MQSLGWTASLRAGLETPPWQKALVIVGGTAVVAGTLWYLFRDSDADSEVLQEAGPGDARPASHYFKVIGTDGYGIGIRAGPSIEAPRIGQQVRNQDVFAVSEILDDEPPQQYLKLADGRGWVFTHSKDGEEIVKEITWEQAMEGLDEAMGGAAGISGPSAEEMVAFQHMMETAGMPVPSPEETEALLRNPKQFGELLRAVAAVHGANGMQPPPF